MGNGTSIGRVRGLGAAHSGTHHWMLQHLLSIGSLILTVWLVASVLMLPNLSYLSVHDWLVRPVPAVALGLFVLVNIWHAKLGLQVVVEDYVHEHANKFACIVLLNLVAFAAAAFGLFCVIRLALGGA